MISVDYHQHPTVISGVGGSGTRVIANILLELGFFMGHNLDPAHDNLSFSVLFMRPQWFFSVAKKDPTQIQHGLNIFTAAMTEKYRPQFHDMAFFGRVIAEGTQVSKRRTRLKRLWKLVVQSKRLDPSEFVGWGWKEPILHIYIEYLTEYFSHLKWIHVIRNGLDMAYSKNQRQVRDWGPIFGVDFPAFSSLLPQASLGYWVKANLRALEIGNSLGEKRFLAVNFDQLCRSPEREIDRINSFLDVDVDEHLLDRLYTLPQVPESTGRHRQHDLSIFPAEDLAIVSKLGFAIDP